MGGLLDLRLGSVRLLPQLLLDVGDLLVHVVHHSGRHLLAARSSKHVRGAAGVELLNRGLEGSSSGGGAVSVGPGLLGSTSDSDDTTFNTAPFSILLNASNSSICLLLNHSNPPGLDPWQGSLCLGSTDNLTPIIQISVAFIPTRFKS